MSHQDNYNWVTVFEAANIDEANIIMGLLKGADIPVILEREAVGAIYGLSVGPLSEVLVRVPKDKAASAVQVLNAAAIPEE